MKKTLLATLAMAAALSASAVEIELLTNGEGTTLNGWTQETTFGFAIYTDSADNSWFVPSMVNKYCVQSQTFVLSDLGITADELQNNLSFNVSVTVSSDYGNEICNVRVLQLDADGVNVETDTFVEMAKQTFSETNVTASFTIKPETRKLQYQFSGQTAINGATANGPRFRNCSLKLTRNINVTFYSAGTTLQGSWEQPPIAPRNGDYRFLGYFTAPTDGVKVFDENYDFVQASAPSLTSDTTLYAQWAPVVSAPEGGITRLVYRGVLTNFGEWSSGLKKTMHVKVYDSASAATPLWSGDAADVPINPDGSFEAVFGNDELALAFASNNVTHVELTVGDSLSPLAPRRAFASVASVNRALVAEGAASDIKVGTLGANAIVAEKITAASLEASETVRVEGSVSVEVKPFDVKSGQETTIRRGAGVSVWGESRHIHDFDNVVAGQRLWIADGDGVVMIHCSGSPRSTLRMPATIQFVRPGGEVRAPTYDNGKVSVTFWGYKK
jgi:hypothetical protein